MWAVIMHMNTSFARDAGDLAVDDPLTPLTARLLLGMTEQVIDISRPSTPIPRPSLTARLLGM